MGKRPKGGHRHRPVQGGRKGKPVGRPRLMGEGYLERLCAERDRVESQTVHGPAKIRQRDLKLIVAHARATALDAYDNGLKEGEVRPVAAQTVEEQGLSWGERASFALAYWRGIEAGAVDLARLLVRANASRLSRIDKAAEKWILKQVQGFSISSFIQLGDELAKRCIREYPEVTFGLYQSPGFQGTLANVKDCILQFGLPSHRVIRELEVECAVVGGDRPEQDRDRYWLKLPSEKDHPIVSQQEAAWILGLRDTRQIRNFITEKRLTKTPQGRVCNDAKLRTMYLQRLSAKDGSHFHKLPPAS